MIGATIIYVTSVLRRTMKQTRNKQGRFNYKYQGAKEFILELISEGKSDNEILALTLLKFEGISTRTILWYIEKYRPE